MKRLYEKLGAWVVEGGSSLNPSTFELLAGIHGLPAPEVVVLPNSGNVIMAADRAAELSEKTVAVVESRWPHAGLACLIEHSPELPAEVNAARLSRALESIEVGAVAPAARDDKQGRFAAGDAVGFIGEEIVAWGSAEKTLAAVLDRLGEGSEIITWFSGEGAPIDAGSVEALAQSVVPGVEVEGHEGGQPHYWWLVVAE
jgi:hypothetical protein